MNDRERPAAQAKAVNGLRRSSALLVLSRAQDPHVGGGAVFGAAVRVWAGAGGMTRVLASLRPRLR